MVNYDRILSSLVENGIRDSHEWTWALGEYSHNELNLMSSKEKIYRLQESGLTIPDLEGDSK